MNVRRRAFAAGAVGMVVTFGVVELVHGLYQLVPSVLLAVAQRIIELTPGDFATRAVETLGAADIPTLIATVVILTVALAGWHRRQPPKLRPSQRCRRGGGSRGGGRRACAVERGGLLGCRPRAEPVAAFTERWTRHRKLRTRDPPPAARRSFLRRAWDAAALYPKRGLLPYRHRDLLAAHKPRPLDVEHQRSGR